MVPIRVGYGTRSAACHYFGGSISTAVCDAHLSTEPLSLVDLFESARAGAGVDSVDLLVVPCPPIGRAYPDFRSRIQAFVVDELHQRIPNPEPGHVAMLGNSAGAHIAAMLAFELERVRALATTGAVGLVEASDENELRLVAGRRYKSFANGDDPCSTYTHQFWESMILRGIAVDVIERAGGHAFEDCVANGSVREAFEWLIAELWKHR